jgi:hypothetical protein
MGMEHFACNAAKPILRGIPRQTQLFPPGQSQLVPLRIREYIYPFRCQQLVAAHGYHQYLAAGPPLPGQDNVVR